MGKHFRDEENDSIEGLKRAAANRAVNAAANGGRNLSTLAGMAGKGIVNGVKSVGMAFSKGFGLVTGKVATAGSAVGLSPLASNLAVILVAAILGSTTVSYVQEANYLNDLRYNTVWDDEDPCAGFTIDDAEIDPNISDDAAARMQSVRQIWSFCHWYAQQNGSSLSWEEVDVRVAGMLGCFARESGISPAGIEGTYGAANVRERIRELSSGSGSGAIKVGDQTVTTLGGFNISAYSEYSEPIAKRYSGVEFYHFTTSESMNMGRTGHILTTIHGDGGYYCGLGLGQLTGPRAIGLLAYSDMAGVPWYDITCQLAYWVTGDDPYYTSGAFIPYLTGTRTNHQVSSERQTDNHYTDPEDACRCWAVVYEGGSADQARLKAAKEWYDVIKMWSQSQIDQTTINSVVAILAKTAADANLTASMDLMGDCGEINGLGNMTIADYASLIAYDGKMSGIYSGERLAHYDNGTPLYRYVCMHTGIADSNTNPYDYQDCAFGTCAVLRWAGADDSISPGATNARNHMMKHRDRWQTICSPGNYHWDDIQPGDVLAYTGHIFIYVGEEAWLRFHLGPNDVDANGHSYCSITYDPADTEHGGQTVYAPRNINIACGSSWKPNGSSTNSRSFAGQGMNTRSLEADDYYVFRNIKPEENSQYANIVDLDRLVVGASTDGHVSTSVVANGSLNGGHNTQCTTLPDYTIRIDGVDVVVTNRYHFSWQSVRSNRHGGDDRISGCPDYANSYAADFNIHPRDATSASI